MAMQVSSPLLLLVIGAATACVEETAVGGSDRPTPSPYEPDVTEPTSAPSLTPELASAAVPQLLGAVAEFRLEEAYAAYAAFWALADGDDCPEREAYQTATGEDVFWYSDGCTTAEGTYFYGSGAHTVAETTDADGTVTRIVAFGDDGAYFEVRTADGRFLSGSPSVELYSVRSPDGSTTYEAYVAGAMAADETTGAASAWLRGEQEGSFSLFAFEDAAGYRYAGLYGLSLVTAPGAAVAAFAAPELGADNTAGCAMRAGVVSMRDPAGAWHDAVFGVEDDGSPASCDACADLSHAGAPLGSFCAPAGAFEALLGWEVAPW